MSILPNPPKQKFNACNGKHAEPRPDDRKGRATKSANKQAEGQRIKRDAKKSAGVVKDYQDLPIPASVDRFVRERDGNRCQGCGLCIGDVRPDKSVVRQMHIDHIDPRKANGRNDPDNLRCACERCNGGKRARPAQDFDRPAVVQEPPPPKPDPNSPEKVEWRGRKTKETKLTKALQRGREKGKQ